MQEYYTNTIESKFIKELLRTTYIPTVPIWKPGKKIIAGLTYITDNYILKCNVSSDGVIYDEDNNLTYLPSSIYDMSDKDELDKYGQPTGNKIPYFEIIEPYVPGKFYRGITTNFISNSSLYDPKTHYYLGEYLRMVRDLYNIDLMPYYNCWDGRYTDTLRIKDDSYVIKFTSKIIEE